MFNLPNLSSKSLLLGSASLAALLITAPANATTFTSMTGRGTAQVTGNAAPRPAGFGAASTPGQAATATAQSAADFSTALARIQAQMSAQATARSTAQAGPNNLGADPNHPGQNLPDVPNGLGSGGLVAHANPSAADNAAGLVWENAGAPTQATSGAQTTVTVQQTAQKAILTWDSFNVGKNTTVHFDQTKGTQADGSNTWIALNRVIDPSNRPSQILGNITAEGTVYLINRNGIVFGGTAQVNVHSLIASSLNLFNNDLLASNNRFRTGGIGDLNGTNAATNSILLTSNAPGAGDVVIDAGAAITTASQGLALIAAPNVSNGGTITAPSGQAALIAGVGVSYDYNSGNFGNDGSSTLLDFANYGKLKDAHNNDITPVGTLTNTGLIYTPRGNITLLGGVVAQNGAAIATTSVAQPGSVLLSSLYEVGINGSVLNPVDETTLTYYTGTVSLGPNAITAILPDTNGVTLASDANSLAPFRTPLQKGILPTEGPGLISIAGQAIDFQGGSLTYAPGQGISANVVTLVDPRAIVGPVPGSGRIALENGAILDVSGIADVQLPASSNLLTVKLAGNELADDPLQQSGPLYGMTITVDMLDQGVNAETGEAWVGTPLANLASYANLVQNSISQLLVNGGSVLLGANEVTGAPGSIINLSGGYIHNLAGKVVTTRLMDANGRLVSVGNADPNDIYVGVAGLATVHHDRWGITDSYVGSLLAGSLGIQMPDDIQGGNAGSLNVTINVAQSSTLRSVVPVTNAGAAVLDSTVLAGAVAGMRQASSGALPDSGIFSFSSILPIEIAGPDALPATALLPAYFGMNSALLAAPGSAYAKANVLNSQLLSGFSSVTLTAGGTNQGVAFQAITEDAGASLTVQPGGTISMLGDNTTINGTLTAHSGTISITTRPNASFGLRFTSSAPGDILIGSGALLDVSGLFVDDRQLPLAQQGLPVPVNAGSISLETNFGNSAGPSVLGPSFIPDSATDLTGNITLAAGSLLNLQSGGHVLANGQLQRGGNKVPLGVGGSLTLETNLGYAILDLTSAIVGKNGLPQRGVLTTDGMIEAQGFTGGGTLTLEQIALQVGGNPAATPPGAFYFDAGHWGDAGFGSFVLNALTSVSVPDNAVIRLQHQNLLPSFGPEGAPVGVAPASFLTPGFLTGTERSPTNLAVNAGLEAGSAGLTTILENDSLTIGNGTQILGDAGANISLSSLSAATLLGTIRAPGGSISVAVVTPNGGITPAGPLYLGPQSVLDVSGVVVSDPLALPVFTATGFVTPHTGKIYAGGTINLTDNNTSILVAPGAVLDVAGTSGTFDVQQLIHGGPAGSDQIVLTPQSQWSDGGAINVTASLGLLMEGTLLGQGGAPQASGGTLSIAGTGIPALFIGSTLVLVEDTAQALKDAGAVFDFSTFVPVAKVSSGNGLKIDPAISVGTLLFGADRLDGSGFANLVLGEDFTGSFGYSGQVTLNLGNSVIFNTGTIIATREGAINFSFNSIPASAPGNTHPTNGAFLTVNAPYIALNGTSGNPGSSNGYPNVIGLPSGDGVMTLNAGQIDLSAYLNLGNIGQATFNSAGDMRLLPAQIIIGNYQGGYLETAGNLSFNAADIYPATNTAFVIQSVGANGTVTFGYPAGGAASTGTPLSAEGALVVSAANIVQDGQLQAPFGTIILGTAGGASAITTALNGFPGHYQTAVNTQSVTLGDGSITSVSANGATIPFGTTVDQTTWNYNPAANNPNWIDASVALQTPPNPVTDMPQASVVLHGASIAYGPGSVVDVSGGGDLQAQEWIPGTGGSRDGLSQFNTSYTTTTVQAGKHVLTGTQVPLYADGRAIFAIVPGYSSKVAPYDATMAQAGIAPGQQIYLAGGPGLAAGYYTLFPAKYATQPGAFRVVVNSGVTNPLRNPTLADGTMEMAGYFTDGFNGAHPSSFSQFMVQPASIWERYSQYALTSANSFFPDYAAENGLAAPIVPNDAGHLVVAATSGLTLGGKVLGSPGPGGLGGQVDISSQFLEIVGDNEAVDPGYIGVSADALDALGANSLLIGGTRTTTADGTVITPTATGVIVANDAAHPLTGEQIFLVVAPQFRSSTIQIDNEGDTATIQTPVAGTGLVSVRSGSVIQATGKGSDVGGQKLILGNDLSALPVLPSSVVASSTDAQGHNSAATAIQSYYNTLDATLGTVVEISAGAPDSLQLPNAGQLSPGTIPVVDNLGANPSYTIALPSLAGAASATGAVIESGARIDGGNVLTLATTGDSQVQSGALLSGKNFSAISGDITFVGAGTAPANGLVIDANLLAQLEQSSSVNLQSYGAIAFQGDVNIAMAAADGMLTLSGGTLSGDGGQVTIAAPTVELENVLNGAASAPAGNSGTLSVNANQLIFGLGAGTIGGFASANLTAQQAIIGQRIGSTDFGAMPVSFLTSTLIADTGSSQSLTTTGALSVASIGSGAPMTSGALGGAITLQGGSVTVAVPVQAQGGNITLQSSAGDVTLTGTGALITHGIAKQFGDTTEYAGGGAIRLTADQGTVNIQSGAVVDFAGAAKGGDGGSLSISTTGSTTPVTFGGTLLGATAPGAAGSTFSLDSAGAADLDSLTKILTNAGVTGGIAVQTGQGDLSLTGNLTASQVALVANGGLVTVGGTIDASGAAGGTIQLFGTGGVDVEGSLLARASDPTQLGGTVEIGTSGNFNPATGTYNASYGYENLATSGTITIGPNAVIDVSGGTKGALSGGTVLLRAPILANNSVNVVLSPTATFKGARSVGLEAYATWSTADATTGAKHFDGIVDPSGWYDSTGTLLAGNFVDSGGNVLAGWSGSSLTNDDGTTNNLSYYLTNDYFQPNAADAAHESFYGFVNGNAAAAVPGTLMGFVQASGVAAVAGSSSIANFQIVPGIELANPVSAGVNNGDIRILTNWNLGAENASGVPLFRLGGIAPHIAFRAGRNVLINASITDGFQQLSPIAATPAPPPAGGFDFVSYNSLADNFIGFFAGFAIDDPSLLGPAYFNGLSFDEASTAEVFPALPSQLGLANGDVQDGYYGAYTAYDNIYNNAYLFGTGVPFGLFSSLLGRFGVGGATPPASVTNLLATANAAYGSISSYNTYLTDYLNYFTAYGRWIIGATGHFGAIVSNVAPMALPPPVTSLPPPIPPVPTPTNAPNVIDSATNSVAIASMSLAAEASSSSYRIVAGADVRSANPLAVNPAASGSVTLDGHTDVGVLAHSNALIAVPTIVRTGTGSIDIAAAGDFELLDHTAPGVVYTAGTVNSATAAGSTIALSKGAYNITDGAGTRAGGSGVSTILTPEVNPDNAGNITLEVGGNIIGFQNVIDTLTSQPVVAGVPLASGLSSTPGAFLGQFWLPWLLTNPANPDVPWYVNFGSFDQGIMSIGGNVTVRAGGDIRDLGVSLPTTSYLDSANGLHLTGGGTLKVSAGGNIYSGDFYVGQGAGSIRAGGAIASDFTYMSISGLSYPVQTLLAVQYATIDVQARQSADIGGIYDPTYLWNKDMMSGSFSPVASYASGFDTAPMNFVPYVTSMSTDSGASIQSTGGDVTFNSLLVQGALFNLAQAANGPTAKNPDGSAVVTSLLLPASLNLVALDGGINIDHGGGLYPSATGTLAIVADQSIDLAIPVISVNSNGGTVTGSLAFGLSGNVSGSSLGKLDDLIGTGILPTGSDSNLIPASQVSTTQARDPSLVADGATASVLVYSQNGSLVDGTLLGVKTVGQVSLIPNAPAQINVALDILDLPFFGENFDADDITSLIAGRDIRYNAFGNGQPAIIEIAGPGILDVEAGRNFNLQTQRANLQTQNLLLAPAETGIRTLGNSVDGFGNPYLPRGGASVNVLFGIAPGLDQAAFIDQYINPANATSIMPSSLSQLLSFVDQYETAAGKAAPQTVDQAWAIFQTLPAGQQQLLAQDVFLAVLDATGKDYNNPASPFFHQYARGYQAINTLFPANLGYTANDLTGGTNGANKLVVTGNLDMRGSTIQTQQGGDISIFGPGGHILVGSSTASPAINPGSEGILTLEKGNISTFTDTDVLVAQSRVMTEQGGSILMWTSNGNLDAGKGVKTSVSAPPPLFACDIDFICVADFKGEVSGAGIATLQSLPGVPVGDADLVAPRGTVDAGAAGIRVSGNLNIAAQTVANAFNIEVQGKTFGLPPAPVTNLTLTTASTAATEAAGIANTLKAQQPATTIDVEVTGFGGDFQEPQECLATSTNKCATR